MANDFSRATGCIAVYSMEVDALGTDSKGSNDLTVTGVSADIVNFKEGAASGDFELSEGDEMFLADASLSAGFPLKYGTTTYSLTWTCWIRPESTSASFYHYFLGKEGSNTTYSTGLYLFDSPPKVNFQLYRTSGPVGIRCNDALTLGQWYFVAATYDHATHTQTLRVWDDVAGAWLTEASNSVNTNTPTLSASRFSIGAPNTPGVILRRYDGNIDEVTVWNRAVSFADLDLIRQGLYRTLYSVPPAIFFSQKGYEESLIYKPAMFIPRQSVETLGWKTDIIKPKDSSQEQRIALRGVPRQGFRYKYQIDPGSQRRTLLENQLFNNLKGQWGVPVWHEHVHHTGTLSAGSTSISIDTRYADFRDNSYAIVWKSPTNSEVVRISTKTDSVLNLSIPTVNTYTSEKLVVPMRFGYILLPPKRIRRESLGEYDLLEVEFTIVDNVAVTGHTAAQTYDGMDVLLRPHHRVQELSDTFDGDILIHDNDTGLVGISSYSEFNVVNQAHTFHLSTKQELWEFRQWLHAMYGPQTAFLVPTFLEDMTITRLLAAGATSVYVGNAGLTEYMGLNTMRTYLAFEKTDKTLIPRKITGISEVDVTEELLTINTAPGTQFAVGSPVMFLDRCRLGSDILEIEHRVEDGDSICNTGFVRVEQ